MGINHAKLAFWTVKQNVHLVSNAGLAIDADDGAVANHSFFKTLLLKTERTLIKLP